MSALLVVSPAIAWLGYRIKRAILANIFFGVFDINVSRGTRASWSAVNSPKADVQHVRYFFGRNPSGQMLDSLGEERAAQMFHGVFLIIFLDGNSTLAHFSHRIFVIQ